MDQTVLGGLLLALVLGLGALFLLLPGTRARFEPVVEPPPETETKDPDPTPALGEAELAASRPASRETTPGLLVDSGTIVGELQVEVGEGVPPVDAFWIYLREPRTDVARSPKTLTFPFRYNDEGGRFRITGVPLGAWRITAVVPELVGGETVRVLSPQEPVVRVVLTVRRGRRLPIYIHTPDPDRQPLAGVDVVLQPKGDPPGRKARAGKTDPLGNVVLENVLHGPYELHVGPAWKLLAEPLPVEVGPTEPIVVRYPIPKGGEVQVMVLAEGGYPLEGAECILTCFETPRFREFKLKSDGKGAASFGKIPAGRYILKVIKADGFRAEVKPGVEVKEDEVTRLEVVLQYSRP